MSKAYSSPTARLLQSSRLFSLPKPLPTPPTFSIGPTRGSDTATQQYPTHQAIDSPFSSRSVGEWGLKRQLPLRTTAKSRTPLRILAQDTNDHITDFASSGDYTMTLAKFQELGIPIVKSLSRAGRGLSVYEKDEDITDPEQGGSRWKKTGPWLPSLSAEQMETYLTKLSQRRQEWLEYLAEHIAEDKFRDLQQRQKDLDGYFGPLDCQPLEIQRDVIISEAEQEVSRLNELDEEGLAAESIADKDALAARTAKVMQDAVERAADLEREIETQSQWRKGIAHMASVDSDAERLERSAQAKFKAQVEDAPDDTEYIYECQKELDRAQREQAELLRQAYIDTLVRFGEPHDDASEQSLEDSARKVLAIAEENLTLQAREREEGLKQWTIQQRRERCQPSEEEVKEYEKRLRKEFKNEGLHSELSVLLAQFLDLPGIDSVETRYRKQRAAQSVALTASLQEEIYESRTGEKVPSSTHLGAGLGYLRSAEYAQNHPLYGPQARLAPVPARVLQPRRTVASNQSTAKLGVAGFVALDSKNSTTPARKKLNMNREELMDLPTSELDPDTVGGGKLLVRPVMARVSSRGTVEVQVARPSLDSVDVKTGGEHLEALLDQKKAALGGVLNNDPPPKLSNRDLGLAPRSQPYSRLGLGL